MKKLKRVFHMIATIAAIAEKKKFGDRSDHSDGSDHMETMLKRRKKINQALLNFTEIVSFCFVFGR